MKEQIYTIPVKDAFSSDCECPLCRMHKDLEDAAVAFVLSPSYMEEDVRGQTNDLGFCPQHMSRLYNEGNVLGLCLMLESGMKHQHQKLMGLTKDDSSSSSKGIFGRKNKDEGSDVAAFRASYKKSCYICNRIDTTFDRYIDTFFQLYKKDGDFRKSVEMGKGYCVDHFLLLWEKAPQYLAKDQLTSFRTMLRDQMDQSLTRIESDLEWFEKKFDYQYRDQPWKNSKDAVPRAVLKLNSQFLPPKK